MRDALAEGHRFKRVVEVKGYLKDAGLSEELISEHIEEIFDCYLDLESQPRIGNAGPSPPPSEGLPVQPSTQTVPGEASADSNGIAPPVFHSDVSLNTDLNNSANRIQFAGHNQYQLLPTAHEQLASHRREDLRR